MNHKEPHLPSKKKCIMSSSCLQEGGGADWSEGCRSNSQGRSGVIGTARALQSGLRIGHDSIDRDPHSLLYYPPHLSPSWGRFLTLKRGGGSPQEKEGRGGEGGVPRRGEGSGGTEGRREGDQDVRGIEEETGNREMKGLRKSWARAGKDKKGLCDMTHT